MDSREKRELIYQFILILVFVVSIAVIITAGITYKNCLEDGIILTKEEFSEDSSENIGSIAVTLRNFRRLIDEYYLGEIDEKQILDETIKGYVKGLGDEYSEYLTKEDWEEFETNALGNYVGIGIYMSLDKNDNVVIVSAIAGTPAEEAGLKPEDIIVEVNGENVIGLSMEDVANKVKGEAGTKVKIKVARGEEYLDFEIERKEIKIYHVQGEVVENNIGYIFLETFDEGCADEFLAKYKELKSKGAEKLIIDLRYNTGGLVYEALEIADYMLDKNKTILITKDADGNEEMTKTENGKQIDMDIVVLVNEYTASASEILAGALSDHGEATIVGEKTYGKGVIQNAFPLADGSVLKLTVNEYLTPNGNTINKIGITPDEEVVIDPENKDEKGDIIDSQMEKAIEILKGTN